MVDPTRNASASRPGETDGGEAKSKYAKAAAEEVLDDLRRQAEEYIELGREKALAMTDVIEQQIRQRPVPAVAVAAGIGLALGFLWARRR